MILRHEELEYWIPTLILRLLLGGAFLPFFWLMYLLVG